MPRLALKNYFLETYVFTRRVLVAVFFIIFCLSFLIGRLIYLQIIKHDLYTTLSDKNQLALIPLAPNRGLIYDRNGVLLADDIPTFNLEVIPERVNNLNQSLKNLEKWIDIKPDELKQFHKALKQQRTGVGIPLKFNLNETEVARFYLNQFRFPGFHITGQLMRYYPMKDIMVSVLGYVARINEEELARLDTNHYMATDYIGKVGVEKYYEERLHGQSGYQQVEIDADGRVVRVLKRIAPIAGDNLYLSIDNGLQKASMAALGGDKGAIVAIEPKTGQILAFVSNPHYDPNMFVKGISSKDYSKLQHDSQRPLYNRPLRGLYPCGSTIKPFLGIQLLEQNIVTPNTTIWDPGYFKLPNSSHLYKDWIWRQGGHGTVNLHKAIVESCDVYFYNFSTHLGINRLHAIEDSFGLGKPTGLDVNEELPGVAPTPAWKQKTQKQAWYLGDTVNTSIGQGYTLTTPLQMATATATLANRGIAYQPRFALKWQHADGTWVIPPPVALAPILLKQKDAWDIVINAMKGVVNEAHGTAHVVVGSKLTYNIAGKTGTAQVYRPKSYGDIDSVDIPKKYRSHSWFIAFAPVEKPIIALAVIIENYPHRAPIVARKILDYYLLPNHGKTEEVIEQDVTIDEDAPSD